MSAPLFEVGQTYPLRDTVHCNRTATIIHQFEDGRYVCASRGAASGREYVFVVNADGKGSANAPCDELIAPDVTEDFFV